MRAAAPPFDIAIYEALIKRCLFEIRCGDLVAVINLHMEDETCWDLFKALDHPQLYVHESSTCFFSRGSGIKTNMKLHGDTKLPPFDVVPPEFAWLEECLAQSFVPPYPSFVPTSLCHYYGTDFYRITK